MIEPVYFVSLGPGDPELVTLKALKALRGADRIYAPAVGSDSRAAAILSALEIAPERIRTFSVPMSEDRALSRDAYRVAAAEIAADCRTGLRAAVTAEGDAGFYATTDYLAERLAEVGISTVRIAGVPAFLACGALAGIPVVRRDGGLEVVPGTVSPDGLRAKLSEGKTVVVMKASRCEATLKQAIEALPEVDFHYFENVGVSGREFYTSRKENILARKFPYFSLLIIQKHE
jgi:precorrin-2/cobalt-factor-2 C20-methyltransferase